MCSPLEEAIAGSGNWVAASADTMVNGYLAGTRPSPLGSTLDNATGWEAAGSSGASGQRLMAVALCVPR